MTCILQAADVDAIGIRTVIGMTRSALDARGTDHSICGFGFGCP